MLNIEVKGGERYITNGKNQDEDIADFAEIVKEHMGFEAYKYFKDVLEDVSDIETYEADCEHYRDLTIQAMDEINRIVDEMKANLFSAKRFNRAQMVESVKALENLADTIYKNA